ncbi:MAG: hypothetical protein ACRDRA_00570 [Pseudonocardiaceae bacterium]
MTAVEHTETGRPYCCDEDLPVDPFLALRVAYGMLLGEDDFRALMGNPRGKQMLHNAWLHGSGVVWGYGVRLECTSRLRVTPGLAVDGLGRELVLEAEWCGDIEELLDRTGSEYGERELTLCLVAVFDTCRTAPVPALADPCDLSRKHTDFSRVLETVRLELRKGACPAPADPGPYHRLRVLLGLDPVGENDPAGTQAYKWACTIAQKPTNERAAELLRAFRVLAAYDVIDLAPDMQEGDVCPSLFPVAQDDAPVPLATVTVTVRGTGSGTEIVSADVDPTVRRSLVATGTIQELTCGLAPGVLGVGTEQDAGGPRVIPESVSWPDPANRLRFTVTGPLLEGSLRDHPIVVTSLSERGWVREDIERISYDAEGCTVTVVLHDPPAYDLVRVIVRGTGPTPVFGANRVPLAGLVGGPPGSRHDGHDAVLTTTTIDRRAAD